MKQYDRFKLWMENTTSASSRKDDLIISSHGGRSLLGGRSILTGFHKKKVPAGVDLVFYGPDRSAIVAGTIKFEFVEHNLQGSPRKIKKAGDEYVDYELTKLQGYHGNEDETYDVVQECLSKYDVATIRYRPLKWGGIHLSSLMSQLIEDGFVYKRIHCCFCRSYQSSVMELIAGRDDFYTPT